MPVPPSGVIPTSLAQVPARSQKSAGCQFRLSPRYLLCGVAFPGGATTGVGVDERVEGASGRLTSCSVLLEVDQVEQAAPPVCPLVEPHLSVASFDDLNEASEEVEALRTVFPPRRKLCRSARWLARTRIFSSARRSGWDGGGKPQPNPAVTKTLSPWWPETVKHWRTLH